MNIFVSYASEDHADADEIALALAGFDHSVFLDRNALEAGGNYISRISAAIADCDIMIFLISPHSIRSRSYALTELKLAQQKWRHPKNRLLPVMLKETPIDSIPAYLRSVTILEPMGSVSAEVAYAVEDLALASRYSRSQYVRVLTHFAYFLADPSIEHLFVNVTNHREFQDVEVTHVWIEATPRLFVLQSSRPLPVRLKPWESWETWIGAEQLYPSIRRDPFNLARVRLSSGEIYSSTRNTTVPERGQVPGGPILRGPG